MLQGKILVAQGGGPTAVINQSMVGVVLDARRHETVTGVYGALHGVNGILNENFIDLSKESESNLERVGATPCSALGSTRDKPDVEYCRKIFNVLQAHQIGTFFYIGGNDSSDALRILAVEAAKANYPLRCIHIPKTIDNDLMVNDHTPGYPSAAKFVASAFAGIDQDNRALPGVYVGVVMGRHAGFLTAAAAGGRRHDDDGPHLIYLPERVFSMTSFLADVKRVNARLGRCVVAVSEGIHDANGTPIVTTLTKDVEKDAHGNIQLSGTGALADLLTASIKKNTDISRVRGDTFGYLQRSFLGCVSDVDQQEARDVGIRAVQFAASEDRDGSVTLNRVNTLAGDYGVEYRLDALDDIAGKTKIMSDDMIDASGTDITPAFMSYLTPLLGTNAPAAYRLQAPNVPKVLAG